MRVRLRSGHWHDVMAHRFGRWAATECIETHFGEECDGWQVTHVATGARMESTACCSAASAMAVASAMAKLPRPTQHWLDIAIPMLLAADSAQQDVLLGHETWRVIEATVAKAFAEASP
jgi:hypothetical protein